MWKYNEITPILYDNMGLSANVSTEAKAKIINLIKQNSVQIGIELAQGKYDTLNKVIDQAGTEICIDGAKNKVEETSKGIIEWIKQPTNMLIVGAGVVTLYFLFKK